jgi:chemotaxis protein methyltransferase CheR
VGQALPGMLERGRKKIRLWSAASSSGEEPYTLAMYLAEHFPVAQGWDWRIVASDISTKVLALAQRAVYPDERVQTVPREWLRRHFQQGTGQWAGHVRVRPELTQRVQFRQINLIAPYEHAERYDAIFCRNVMIYFDRPTQEQLVNRLCRFLAPGGYLFIGHAESLNGQNVPLRCLQPSIYRHL